VHRLASLLRVYDRKFDDTNAYLVRIKLKGQFIFRKQTAGFAFFHDRNLQLCGIFIEVSVYVRKRRVDRPIDRALTNDD